MHAIDECWVHDTAKAKIAFVFDTTRFARTVGVGDGNRGVIAGFGADAGEGHEAAPMVDVEGIAQTLRNLLWRQFCLFQQGEGGGKAIAFHRALVLWHASGWR
jgi:hypothetical protein